MDGSLNLALRAVIEALITQTCPNAILVPKYGGQMIEVVAGDPKSQIGGFFFYDKHASFEFTHGATLADPDGILEGGGKYRRHIKLRCLGDIEEKDVAGYLAQAVAQVTA